MQAKKSYVRFNAPAVKLIPAGKAFVRFEDSRSGLRVLWASKPRDGYLRATAGSRKGLYVAVTDEIADHMLEKAGDRPYLLLEHGFLVPWKRREVCRRETGELVLADAPLRSDPHIKIYRPKKKEPKTTVIPTASPRLTQTAAAVAPLETALTRILLTLAVRPFGRGRPSLKELAGFDTLSTAYQNTPGVGIEKEIAFLNAAAATLSAVGSRMLAEELATRTASRSG